MHRIEPKRTIQVAGETIEYAVGGTGRPTIVLVNGAGGPIEAWGRLWQPLTARAATLAYNRPGIGRSPKPARPQVGSHLVASLAALLDATRQAPPYLLVGHSLGGLIVNLFARRHPELVAGVVLLEATSPDDPAELRGHETRLQRLVRTVLTRVAPPSPLVESEQIGVTVGELRDAPPFPAVPLVVVTGTKPALAWATSRDALAARAANQERLLTLSPLSSRIEATRSGHFPQLSEPDVVVHAIERVLAAPAVSA